jgi:anti-anti-sigma regulatory factor
MYATNRQGSQAYLVPIDPEKLGTNSRQLRRVVGDALERGERSIVVDCSAWNSPDVMMFSTLIGCAQLCAGQGVEFELMNLEGSVHATLRELRLTPRLNLPE